MENDLQHQIAQFVLQAGEIVTRDGVGNLIGFLKCVGSDAAEILLEVPTDIRNPASAKPP
jgi:hypothetical protein